MRHLLTVIVVASLTPCLVEAQESDSSEAAWNARLEKHAGDFDYLLGDWQFRTHNAEWGEGSGFWSAVRLATGAGSHVLDEYRLVGDGGETIYVSSTLRVFNVARGVWELVSAEFGTGLANVGTAQRVGNEMHIEQKFGGEIWRIRYYDIRDDAFSWVADVSKDGGATWHRGYMTIEAQRIGPARDLPALAPPREDL